MLSLLYTLVKLAKSHYLLLSFVCMLYIVFVCLFKLFVCIFNFLLPLVVSKDVHKKYTVITAGCNKAAEVCLQLSYNTTTQNKALK